MGNISQCWEQILVSSFLHSITLLSWINIKMKLVFRLLDPLQYSVVRTNSRGPQCIMGKMWEGHTLPIQNNTSLICPPPLFPNNYGVISQHGNKRLFLKFISFSFEDGNLQPPLCPLEQNSWLRLYATPEKKGNQNYCDLSALLFYHHQLLLLDQVYRKLRQEGRRSLWNRLSGHRGTLNSWLLRWVWY